MGIKFPHSLLVRWKIITLGLPGDASLQSTLYCVSGQVIGSFVLLAIKHYLRLTDPQLCQFLKISAVHSLTSVPQRMNRRGDAPAAAYEGVGRELVDGHDGRAP